MKPVDIVITTWQREWMTVACLKAIKNNTTTPHRIILIDNGSKTDFQSIYAQESDIYVKLDKNNGLEYAKNLGMDFVESELFISMDNDILPYIYSPDWLSQLVNLMSKYPEYGAISLKPQVLVGTNMEMFNTSNEIVQFSHVPGYARIMRTDLVKNVGSWSGKRPLRGHEELWIGEKFAASGIKMGWANFIKCYHLWGRDDEDMWGYKGVDSGHNPVWPIYKNDEEEIKKGVGIEI